ncbi:H-NS family histone-like protein [Shewanella colwelliana]|uniref:H-NS family histone-like protein n=1 Tax=Shewanella colwelliana TaxID=23 RepID=UPI0037370D56
MNEFLSTLTHARKLKAAIRDLSVDELNDVASKLEKLIAERERQAEAEQSMNAARNAQIEAIREQMQALGLSAADIDAAMVKPAKKKRTPRPAKYKIDVDGETITWTGQGRMPSVFKKEIDEGFELNDFLI